MEDELNYPASKIIKNVSATTALDLKAEIAQQLEEFERTKTGKTSSAKKPEKKPTVWSKQNKGVNARNEKDAKQALPEVEGDILARSREQLEKKAKFYEALRSGKCRPDDEDDEEKSMLIDFDRKYMQERDHDRELEQEKERKRKRKRQEKELQDDDPWVEIEDEFGRTRIVRRSQVPAEPCSPSSSDSEEDDEDYTEFTAKGNKDDGLSRRYNMNHYEAEREIRTKGVGFYKFSKDEAERQAQMNKLKQIHQETKDMRGTVTTAQEKRKEMMARNAEKIRARKAAILAKKNHQLKPELVPQFEPVVNEDSVSQFLQSVRKQME